MVDEWSANFWTPQHSMVLSYPLAAQRWEPEAVLEYRPKLYRYKVEQTRELAQAQCFLPSMVQVRNALGQQPVFHLQGFASSCHAVVPRWWAHHWHLWDVDRVPLSNCYLSGARSPRQRRLRGYNPPLGRKHSKNREDTKLRHSTCPDWPETGL